MQFFGIIGLILVLASLILLFVRLSTQSMQSPLPLSALFVVSVKRVQFWFPFGCGMLALLYAAFLIFNSF